MFSIICLYLYWILLNMTIGEVLYEFYIRKIEEWNPQLLNTIVKLKDFIFYIINTVNRFIQEPNKFIFVLTSLVNLIAVILGHVIIKIAFFLKLCHCGWQLLKSLVNYIREYKSYTEIENQERFENLVSAGFQLWKLISDVLAQVYYPINLFLFWTNVLLTSMVLMENLIYNPSLLNTGLLLVLFGIIGNFIGLFVHLCVIDKSRENRKKRILRSPFIGVYIKFNSLPLIRLVKIKIKKLIPISLPIKEIHVNENLKLVLKYRAGWSKIKATRFNIITILTKIFRSFGNIILNLFGWSSILIISGSILTHPLKDSIPSSNYGSSTIIRISSQFDESKLKNPKKISSSNKIKKPIFWSEWSKVSGIDIHRGDKIKLPRAQDPSLDSNRLKRKYKPKRFIPSQTNDDENVIDTNNNQISNKDEKVKIRIENYIDNIYNSNYY